MKSKSIAKFFNHDFTNGPFCLYDKNGNVVYEEDSDGHWFKCERDKNDNIIYEEDSIDGVVIDKRPCKTKIIEVDGKKYKLVPVPTQEN